MLSLLFEVDMMMTIISEREFYCFMDDVKQASCYTQLIVTLATQKKEYVANKCGCVSTNVPTSHYCIDEVGMGMASYNKSKTIYWISDIARC